MMMIIRRYGNPAQRCNNTTACPDVLRLADGRFLYIGERVDADTVSAQLAEHGGGIGPGEGAVVLPPEVVVAAAREIASEVS